MTRERAGRRPEVWEPGTTLATPVKPEPFDLFYRREFSNLTALAAAIMGERTFAEDIAQEALSRAHRQWATVGTYDKPGAWARRATINLALSTRRRRAREIKAKLRLRRERRPALPPAPEQFSDVWLAIRSLPGQQRAAIALHYLEGRPVAEIAEALGCSTSTAKVHLHRGRQALHESINREGDSR